MATIPSTLLVPPFRLICHGRSGQGKTHLWLQLFMTYYQNCFSHIVMFCPSFYADPKYRILFPLLKAGKLKVYSEVTEVRLIDFWREVRLNHTHRRTLLWFDDCMGQPAMRGPALTPIVNNCRHYNLSIVALIQRLIGVSPNFRGQVEGYIGFQLQQETDRVMAYNEFGMGTRGIFRQLMDYATKEDYSYLFMNRQGPTIKYYRRFYPLHWGIDDSHVPRQSEPEPPITSAVTIPHHPATGSAQLNSTLPVHRAPLPYFNKDTGQLRYPPSFSS